MEAFHEPALFSNATALFFGFAAYQRLSAAQSSAATKAQIPTADNLKGDFSTTDPPPGSPADSCASARQLVDPLTGAAIPGNKYATPPTFNASSLALMKFLPKIDPSYDTGNCGFVSYAIPNQQSDNEFVTRVDWIINPKHHFYARYFIDGYQFPAFFSPTNILITTQSGNSQRVQTYTMGEDWTITSSVVNSAHVSWLRRGNNRGYADNALNAVSCCNVNLYQGEPNGLQMTEGKFTIGGGTDSVSHFNDNTVEFNDDFTMVRGKHQSVFGGEFVWNQLNISNAYESNGIFTFNGTFSGSGPNGGTKVGDQNLDFLMGTLSAFQQSKMQQNALRAPIPSLYFQDTYHAPNNSRLSPVFAGVLSGCLSTSSIAAPHSTTTPFSPTRSRRFIPTLPPEPSTTATREFPAPSPRPHLGSSRPISVLHTISTVMALPSSGLVSS